MKTVSLWTLIAETNFTMNGEAVATVDLVNETQVVVKFADGSESERIDAMQTVEVNDDYADNETVDMDYGIPDDMWGD